MIVFAAYWFVLVTMTTVGYGDKYPTSVLGYFATAAVILIGITVTALPIAIVGGNFAVVHEYYEKHQKKVARKSSRKEQTTPTAWEMC